MTHTPLGRTLGTADAVLIGLGSMIGAGVFAAFAPAAAAAGGWLLLSLCLAAVVAYCNATSSAQLAAQYPTSGGTYVYGRERLGHWFGFTAGWGFVVGKTASCAAMALTFAEYAVPGPWWARRLVAVAGLVVLTMVNRRGITRTARLAAVLVTLTLLVLALVVVVTATGEGREPAAMLGRIGPYGVLQAAGLLFFAFAGYARIATLGEEVRKPAVTIPRAIQVALAITVIGYLAVGAALLHASGAAGVAAHAAPVAAAVEDVGAHWAAPIVRVGAALACLGSLLALVAGVGRTTFAMARERDLPRWLASVDRRYHVPDHAQTLVAVAASVLVLVGDLRGVIGFSSFGVLTYYGIANAAAFTQDAAHRRWPRAVQCLGLLGCAALVATLPAGAVFAGLAVFAVGLLGRLVVRRVLGVQT